MFDLSGSRAEWEGYCRYAPIVEQLAINRSVGEMDATEQAVGGKQWPGYKLVAGRSVRRYTGEAEVIKAATEAGFTDIYKTTLLGVGDLEKRMGRKKFGEVLGKYIVKPVGAPTLVPESDPRKPYADAASDFQ